MKSKVISLLLCTLLLVSMLTGCIHQDMGVKMNKDGTGSITTKIGIEKDFYEQLKSMGSDPFDGNPVTEYQYNGSTYVAYAETKEYSSYEAMEKALLDLTYETEMLEDMETEDGEDILIEEESEDIFDVIIKEDADVKVESSETADAPKDEHIFSSVKIEKNGGIFYSSYTFSAVLNPQQSEGLEYNLNDIYHVTLSVEMPAKITGSKGGTVDGNKIVFDIADITESQELAATCEENNTGVVIGIVIGLVVLVGGLFFLFKSKK